MDLLKFLEDFENCRQVLQQASKRTGGWSRWLLGNQLVRTVAQVKTDYSEHFEQLLQEQNRLLLNNLELGHTRALNGVLRELDFENTGRVVAGLAFLAYLLDRWDENSVLSPGYRLDCLALAIWKHTLREGILRGVMQGPRARVNREIRREVEERLTQVQRELEERERERQQREREQQQQEGEMTTSIWRPSMEAEWPPRAGMDPPLEEQWEADHDPEA
ncbi:E1B 19K [Titi monkey adenovirus ECC-2011]|uniref:E1B protein, small T-antigen n=1 Tax=titi monkey adenovirus 1 TaxID=3123084 RepID=G0ZAH2_9ADEN|nr:E1B 19K [Titi monkey adenovirus ECC-2011]AEK98443.1 E1B 19K [Titi monkey adenovirus ECC-2011]